MSVWTAFSGSWGDATKWSGGVPDAAGAVATIDFSGQAVAGNFLISLEDGTDRTVGQLNVSASATAGLIIKAFNGASSAVLRFEAIGGTTAIINADGNGNFGPSAFAIAAGSGMAVVLVSNTLVNTINSDTTFAIAAPISGSGQLAKSGLGALVLSGANSFTGGVDIAAGEVRISHVSNLGSGPVVMHGGGLTVSQSTSIIKDVLVHGGSLGSDIEAASGQTVTLAGPTFTMLNGAHFGFGSLASPGKVVLAVDKAQIGEIAGYDLSGGTVQFGNLVSARDFFRFSGSGLLEVVTGATLDTNGFAARLSNLDFDGGTLRSTTGVLDVFLEYTNAQFDNTGSVFATAGADRLIFFAKSPGALNFSSTTFSGWSDTDDLIRFVGSTGIDNITGTGQADDIFGNAGNDVLFGGLGDDLLNGQAGDDAMTGGGGDDNYVVSSSADTITEAVGSGSDRVNAVADFILPDNVELLSLQGAARSGTGNGLHNSIIGSNGADTLLSGLGGDDFINGRLGNDLLDGGTGEDVLIGGAGKDTLSGGADRDRFTFADGDLNALRGSADIITDFDQGLIEKIVLTNVDGDEALGGLQVLKFIGTAAFSGTPGELRYVQASGNTFIEGNTDSDLVADFMIRLNGLYTLSVTDFTGVTL